MEAESEERLRGKLGDRGPLGPRVPDQAGGITSEPTWTGSVSYACQPRSGGRDLGDRKDRLAQC